MRLVGGDFERDAEHVVTQNRLADVVVERGGEFGEQLKVKIFIADVCESSFVAIEDGSSAS